MLREGVWYSYDKDSQWLSFDALKVVHKVTAVTSGERCSITLFIPGKLERLNTQDWDWPSLAFPSIYMSFRLFR